MKIGIVKLCDEKTAEKELSEGKAFFAADLQSVLDDLNVLEIKHGYNLPLILGEFKYSLMVALGKVAPQEPVQEEVDKKE